MLIQLHPNSFSILGGFSNGMPKGQVQVSPSGKHNRFLVQNLIKAISPASPKESRPKVWVLMKVSRKREGHPTVHSPYSVRIGRIFGSLLQPCF